MQDHHSADQPREQVKTARDPSIGTAAFHDPPWWERAVASRRQALRRKIWRQAGRPAVVGSQRSATGKANLLDIHHSRAGGRDDLWRAFFAGHSRFNTIIDYMRDGGGSRLKQLVGKIAALSRATPAKQKKHAYLPA